MFDLPELDPAQTSRRRIAFVVTRSDAVGGAQVHVLELARALQDRGHAVAVFVGGEGPYIDLLRASRIPVWPLRRMVREIRPVQDAMVLSELRLALSAFNPDLVSCHSTKGGWVGRVVARTLRVPSVNTAHGWQLTPGKQSPAQHAIRVAEWLTARLTESVIVVSDYDRSIALQYSVVPTDKLFVVHNGLHDVPVELWARPDATPPRVVMTARFEWPKDPITVIDAFSRLRDLAWTLELIGDGPERPAIEDAIRRTQLGDRVILSGMRDDVPVRLAAAQAFILSSRREGFPISILEAMRAGLPVVASAVGGIPEAVEQGVTGATVTPGSAEALADVLAPILRDPAMRRRMGEAGRARFVQHFGFERHLRRTWAVYVRAMGG